MFFIISLSLYIFSSSLFSSLDKLVKLLNFGYFKSFILLYKSLFFSILFLGLVILVIVTPFTFNELISLLISIILLKKVAISSSL